MYNRYIPREDGSFEKNSLPENLPVETPAPQAQAPSSFLHSLIPKGLDTGDLLVIVLLLLMSSEESGSNALLTLAIYLFL